MKIMDENLATNSNQVLELGEHFIINQQVHDKNLIPKPFNYLNTDTGIVSNEISLLRTLFIKPFDGYALYCENLSNQTYITDNKNPNIVYRIISRAVENRGSDWGATTIFFVYKYKKTSNDRYKLLLTKAYSPPTGLNHPSHYNRPIAEFIHQDNNTLWLAVRSSSTNLTTTRFLVLIINKKDLYESYRYNFGASSSTNLGLFNDSMYFLLTGAADNTHKLMRINNVPSNYSVEEIYKNTENITDGYIFSKSTEKDDNNCIYFAKRIETKLNIVELKLDLSDLAVKVEERFIDLTIDIDVGSEQCNCSLFDVYDNDGRYFILLINGYPSNNSQYSLGNQGFYIFKYVDDELKYIDSYKFSVPQVGFIPMYDNKRFIFCNSDAFFVYDWDYTEKTLVRKFQKFLPLYVLGVDTNNNIWTQSTDYKVEYFAEGLPNSIVAKFAERDYRYEGEDIESKVLVYCRSFLGEYLSIEAKLTLNGNVSFKDSGEKTMTIRTGINGVLEVPIIISGSGQLNISAV